MNMLNPEYSHKLVEAMWSFMDAAYDHNHSTGIVATEISEDIVEALEGKVGDIDEAVSLDADDCLSFDFRLEDGRLIQAELNLSGKFDVEVRDQHNNSIARYPEFSVYSNDDSNTPDNWIALLEGTYHHKENKVNGHQ